MIPSTVLVVDNYDSFTWNLVHYLMELGVEVRVERNDALSAADALASGAGAIRRNQRTERGGIAVYAVDTRAKGEVAAISPDDWISDRNPGRAGFTGIN